MKWFLIGIGLVVIVLCAPRMPPVARKLRQRRQIRDDQQMVRKVLYMDTLRKDGWVH